MTKISNQYSLTNVLFADTTNGRVGVNNVSPTVALDVTGAARISGGSTISTAVFSLTGNDGGIDINNTGTLASGRTSQIRLVNGTTFFGANDRSYQLINIGTSSTATDFYIQYFNGSSYFDRFRITSDGSIGINGLPNPDSGDTRLQINGGQYGTLNLRSTSVNASVRAHNPNGGLYVGTTSNHFAAIFTNDTERMRITSAGNVGIGTTSPNELLSIGFSDNSNGTIEFRSSTYARLGQIRVQNETSTTSGNMQFHTRSGGDVIERMRITSAGYVGIGTTSPAVRLDVTGTDDVDSSIFFRVYSNNRTVWTGLGYRRIETNSELYIIANDSTIFRNSGTERMRILANGNIGIGNTTPGTKLHVTGTISAVDLIMSGGGSWTYTTNSSWSSHQLIIPSGALSGGGVYLVRIQWGSGDAPYIVYATGLWQPVQSNGGSADAEVALLCSSHQGVGTAIFIRNQSVGGQATSALYARLVNFPQLSGSITTTVSRLM